jgi:hypothetical protein
MVAGVCKHRLMNVNVLRLPTVALLVVALSGCTTETETPPPAAAAASPSATVAPSPSAVAKLRVTDLMVKAGCATPAVIGTQLYSYETGRCTIGKDSEITVAVFDTDALRDQWVTAGRSFGGNLVVGPGWALAAGSPDVAATVAGKLGGTAL